MRDFRGMYTSSSSSDNFKMPSWKQKWGRKGGQEREVDKTKVELKTTYSVPPGCRYPFPEPGQSIWFDNLGKIDPDVFYLNSEDDVSEYSILPNNDGTRQKKMFGVHFSRICISIPFGRHS